MCYVWGWGEGVVCKKETCKLSPLIHTHYPTNTPSPNQDNNKKKRERGNGIEPLTDRFGICHSTTELTPQDAKYEDERDLTPRIELGT